MKTFQNITINNFSETTFIAGSYKEISFYVYTSGCSPLDLSSETVVWELSPYDNQRNVILTKTAVGYNGYARLMLESEDTENFSGKYIQQVKINTLSFKQYPLGRGVVNIVPAIKDSERTSAWWLSGGILKENCIAAYQPAGAKSYEKSKINLANRGAYTIQEEGAAPYWNTTTGWHFETPAVSFLTTGIVLPNKNFSVIVKFSSVGGGSAKVLGTHQDINNVLYIRPDYLNYTLVVYGEDYYIEAPSMEYGVIGICGKKLYKNNVNVYTFNPCPYCGGGVYPILIGGENTNGFFTAPFVGYIQAVAFYNIALSEHQYLSIYNKIIGLYNDAIIGV